MKFVYLDNSTTARPSGEAVSKMLTYYSEKWGTLTQPHKMGQELFADFADALKAVYALLGATEHDAVILTSSGAEAVNQAILSTYQDVSLVDGRNHFISSVIDEAPSLMSLHRLESFGCATTYLKPTPEGIITPKSLVEAITPRTALVSLSWASGLTGVVQPIADLAEICKSRGIRLLVEATHVLGKLFFDLKELPITFLAFNGEQLHAPKGTGALYIRQGIHLKPLITGGIEQAGMRAGSINIPAVAALGVACKQTLEARDYLCTEVARLKMHFEKEIIQRIPQSKVLFEYEERVPNISAIAFPHVQSEALLFLLSRKDVYASMGGGGQQQISYLLQACGLSKTIATCALSFSLSRETTQEELDRALGIIEACYTKLRKASKNLVD